jgi:membrane protease YdiL (CAAX protease family)
MTVNTPSRRTYFICFYLILAGVLVSGVLQAGPLKDAGSALTGPALEKSIKGKAGAEGAAQEGKPLYVAVFLVSLGVMVYAAHLAARFLSDRRWRRKDYYVREVRWSVVDALALILLFFALPAAYSSLLEHVLGASEAVEETTLSELVAAFSLDLVVLLFGVWVLRVKGSRFADGMGLVRRSYGRLMLVGLVAFLAFQPLHFIYTTGVVGFFYGLGLPIKAHPVVEELVKPGGMALKLSLVLTVALCAPFFEEVLFRGFFYQALRQKTNAWTAVLVTGGVFAFFHPWFFQASLVLPLGFLLAYLMEKTGSVIPGMVVHFLVNGTSLLRTILLPV